MGLDKNQYIYKMMEAVKDLKNILFKKDKHKTENNVFQLHHRVNFIIILVGVTVLLAQNYLNENAITCKGGDDYDKAYCWLHGGGQLPPKLAKAASGCVAEQTKSDMGDEKQEGYKLLHLDALCSHSLRCTGQAPKIPLEDIW